MQSPENAAGAGGHLKVTPDYMLAPPSAAARCGLFPVVFLSASGMYPCADNYTWRVSVIRPPTSLRPSADKELMLICEVIRLMPAFFRKFDLCVCMCVYVCMYVCMYVCVCVCDFLTM